MCVLAIGWRVNPEWPFVVVANRDEQHDRPTAALNRWPEGWIGGRDLTSGGTWLAVSERGQFAAVTNRANCGPPDVLAPSRGLLVSDFVTSQHPEVSERDLAAFNPMHLLAVEGDSANLWTNRPKPVVRAVAPGIHALSNGDLSDDWPKVRELRQKLAAWLRDGQRTPETLLDDLRSEATPKTADSAVHRQSSIFIKDALYGTRSSIVVLVDRSGSGQIIERRYDAGGNPEPSVSIAFTWPRGQWQS